MLDPSRSRIGLVLTGGGARAAYQVGALRAISAITNYEKNPFRVISGYSAGAINGTWLGSRCDSFEGAVQCMWDEWSVISSEKIFNTEVSNVLSVAFRWIKDRSFGGIHHSRSQINYLLDTSPLQELIKSRIDYKNLNQFLQSGDLHAVSVTAANYHTGQSVTFFSGSEEIKDWRRLNRMSVRTELEAHHVIASSAIPIFFPPVKIGASHYGDGMVRLNAPLSAAIKLGAERILVIGIRGPSPVTPAPENANGHVTIGEIAGTILNGLFFDSLDVDLDRIERVNRAVSVMNQEDLLRQQDHLRKIPILSLRPSKEVAMMSSCHLSRVPVTLRFLLKGIGLKENRGTDLLSYLSFEPTYLRSQLELGYEDTMRRKDHILRFFQGEEP